jgi:protocatechuate 3,4-dioxygenase beta subunit
MGADREGVWIQGGRMTAHGRPGCSDMTDHVSSRGGRDDVSGALLQRRTPDQILGPYFPVGQMPAAETDLSVTPSGLRPRGEIVEVTGRVLNLDGEPVCGARLVLWQANSFGRYAHPGDLNPAPLDQDFIGFARLQSDSNGSYRIRTVKPGSYPVEPGWHRPPHIHFEVWGEFDRLVTQMYFPGEPQNARDRLLMSAGRPELLIAAPAASTDSRDSRTLTFDIVLARG